MSEDITARLQSIAIDERVESFKPNADVTDAECLGIALAHWADWDGVKIVEAFLSALEDANFHDLREKIFRLAAKDLAR
jgi:hypothetical protein